MRIIVDRSDHPKHPLPESPRRVHLMGICGTGMSALAGMFHEIGCMVTGSDQGFYPPISEVLARLGIELKQGYDPSNLDSNPDLVIVGNVVHRNNPEAVRLESSHIPFTSMPAALKLYFMNDKIRIVVTGTHGKTTVTSMTAWILQWLRYDPSYMVGGIPLNFGTNYRLGRGKFFVIEGDEYDTAYFDKRPKFLHYAPHVGIVTSCEFDHADIYDSLETIQDQFREFSRLIPENGSLIAWTQDRNVRDAVENRNGRLHAYGLTPELEWSMRQIEVTPRGLYCEVVRRGRTVARGTLPVFGVHNGSNALAAIAATERVGIEPQQAIEALGSYRGVRRRQEIVGEIGGVTVIDDFAHHPTAVRVTCEAIRSGFPKRRLVAVFEPRTNTSRRSTFQQLYVPAFLSADIALLREPRGVENLQLAERFSSERLADDLKNRGKEAYAFAETEGILNALSGLLEAGDVVLIMSNGSFDNLASRLLRTLEERDP